MPPDEEVCLWLPSNDGFCAYTITEKERMIPSDEWQKMQVGRFSMTPKAFAEYQKFVADACNKMKCTKEQKEIVNRMGAMVNVQQNIQ